MCVCVHYGIEVVLSVILSEKKFYLYKFSGITHIIVLANALKWKITILYAMQEFTFDFVFIFKYEIIIRTYIGT